MKIREFFDETTITALIITGLAFVASVIEYHHANIIGYIFFGICGLGILLPLLYYLTGTIVDQLKLKWTIAHTATLVTITILLSFTGILGPFLTCFFCYMVGRLLHDVVSNCKRVLPGPLTLIILFCLSLGISNLLMAWFYQFPFASYVDSYVFTFLWSLMFFTCSIMMDPAIGLCKKIARLKSF